jgi:hypothetical protein
MEIEHAISKICSNKGSPLQLPGDCISKRRGAIYDAARLQMLVTWARHAGDAYLSFHELNNVNNVLEELCAYSPGIAAVRLSKGIKVGNIEVPRRDALLPATKKMQNTDNEIFNEIIQGRSIDMICVSGSFVQFLRPLFSARSEKKVKDNIGMRQLIRKLIYNVNKQDKELVPESLIETLGIFLHELFLNTQEHAISDFQRIPYIAHVEGIFVSWVQIDEKIYSSDFNGHDRLSKFWERDLLTSGDERVRTTLRCLQMSFFDSGPGFASRATGCRSEDMDLTEEKQVLINCLQKNVTSKNQVGAGNGLPSVLSALRDIGGMIRIRSGRHAIFNAFAPKDDTIELFDFQDWSTKKLACAEGSVISILIPLRRAK